MQHFECTKWSIICSNSVTRQVNFSKTKSSGKCQKSNIQVWKPERAILKGQKISSGKYHNWKTEMRHFWVTFKHCEFKKKSLTCKLESPVRSKARIFSMKFPPISSRWRRWSNPKLGNLSKALEAKLRIWRPLCPPVLPERPLNAS